MLIFTVLSLWPKLLGVSVTVLLALLALRPQSKKVWKGQGEAAEPEWWCLLCYTRGLSAWAPQCRPVSPGACSGPAALHWLSQQPHSVVERQGWAGLGHLLVSERARHFTPGAFTLPCSWGFLALHEHCRASAELSTGPNLPMSRAGSVWSGFIEAAFWSMLLTGWTWHFS